MAPSRRVVTPKLNDSRPRTPYDRPVNPSTPNRRGGASQQGVSIIVAIKC